MNYIVSAVVVFLLMSCSGVNTNKSFISRQSLLISEKEEVIYFKNKAFNGILFEMYPNQKDTFSTVTYEDGLMNGISKKWFPSHRMMEYREYQKGKKNGKQIAFWENGFKRFEYDAKNDVIDGIFREWTANGKLFHFATYVDGREEGVQKMWYDNGKIRANYIVLNGRRYGLLGTKNCKNVSDRIFVVK
jgi:antitoxin component YwqK of YwqJK toxin-antitoxin module